MADSPVTIDHTEEEIQGQPQAQVREPHDGKVQVRETYVTTDVKILDPNDPLAVQIPEGVGASAVDRPNPLGEALAAGTPEEQFDNPQSKQEISQTKPAGPKAKDE